MPSFRTLTNLPSSRNDERPKIITDIEVYVSHVKNNTVVYLLEYKFYPAAAVFGGEQAFKIVCQVRKQEKRNIVPVVRFSVDSIIDRSNTIIDSLQTEQTDVLNEFLSDPTSFIPNDRLNSLAGFGKRFIAMREQFSITDDSEDIFVYLSVKNRTNITVQEEKIHIPHLRFKTLFTGLIEQPLICSAAVNKITGRNIFYVLQTEGKGFSLFKKNQYNKKYEFIKNFYGSQEKEVHKVVDENSVAWFHPVQYRVIPFSDKLGTWFTDIEIKPKHPKLTVNNQPFFHLIKLEDNKVRLDFFDLDPIKMKSVVLIRDEQAIALLTVNTNTLSYTDELLQQGKIYTYRFEYYDVYGNKQKNNCLKHVKTTIMSAPERINLSTNILNVEQQGDTNIVFELKTEFFESVQAKIKLFLGLNNLGIFEDSLNFNDLQKMVSYQITRQNLTTGEEEDLGVLTNTGTFNDKIRSELMGAKPLTEKNQYRYIITTYARNITTLLPNYVVTGSSTTGVDYYYKPYKWLNPVVLNQGTILFSNENTQRNFASSPFTIGEPSKTLVSNVFTVGTRQGSTGLQQVTSIKISKTRTLIQWIMSDSSFVDSFLIYKQVNGGMKTLANKHPALTNLFECIDVVKPGEKDILYSVVVVYLDGTSQELSSQNKVYFTS